MTANGGVRMTDDNGSDVLERGDIFFAYRPSVGADAVEGVEDVQRFYMILRPDGGGRPRLLVLGRKRLADIPRHQRYWGFVDLVTRTPADIEKVLRAKGGRRNPSQPAARPVGEGRYVIARHGNHTHLAYLLELPREPGEAQAELRIAPEASYVLSIKNPRAASPPGVGLSPRRKARLPKRLQDRFGGRRFESADPPAFLDHEGTEILLVGARQEPEEELDVDIDAESCPDERQADVFKELHMAPSRHPTAPLFTGEWG